MPFRSKLTTQVLFATATLLFAHQALAEEGAATQRPRQTLNQLLHEKDIDLARVQAHLAALPGEEQVRQSTTLDRSRLAVLWQLAAANEDKARLEDFVPADHPALEPIPFEGQNSLLMFRSFKKVFYRTPDGQIAGYNDQSMAWLTGPGYYIVKDATPDPYIDYTEIPSVKPAAWPAIKANESGFSTLVYGHMQDYMRRVHGNIFIGRAVKKGKETENYFVLARP
jgi:hypothetical protein